MRHGSENASLGAEQMQASRRKTRDRDAILQSMDRCTKCGICQAYCPVAAVTEAFPGPKYSGPQAQRFRVIEQVKEAAPSLCSGCGICTSVCPNDVAITDIIAIAKAEMVDGDRSLPLRQRLMNRPDLVGRVGGLVPTVANAVLSSKVLRGIAERLLGIHRQAPLPRIEGPVFRRWLARRRQPDGPILLYFTGCAVEHYDPYVGIAAVRLFNHLGFRIEAPTTACCSLPMLSSGEWTAAQGRTRTLVEALGAAQTPAASGIVSTSTSCSLTIREKYAAYLSMTDERSERVADAITDVCEFLRESCSGPLRAVLEPMPLRILYHGPCQLRGHRVGQPSLELLRLIPGLTVEVSEASCCGVAGTYGYDRDKHDIAMDVGRSLFSQIERTRPDLVVCDSETCRWHIEQATGVSCRHPVEVFAASVRKKDPRDRILDP